MKHLILIVVMLTCACSALGKEKNRDWRDGAVLDVQIDRVYVGSDGRVNSTGQLDSTANYRRVYTVAIESGDRVYVTSEPRQNRRPLLSHPLLMPSYVPDVNQKVKIAVEKNTLYLLRDDGKEFRANIVKVIRKTAAANQRP